ncbi:MAG: response regulator [Desulfuromonadales bacterium]|nr:response regulator [Desulfuromonadales bacterium]
MLKKTILIIDDSASMRAILGDMLIDAGYNIVAAVDGYSGLERVKETKFDLIITDLSMPVMDGIAFMREAKKMPLCKFVPIVVLTGEGDVAKLEEAKKAGASTWLTKPFKEKQLRAVLQMVIG